MFSTNVGSWQENGYWTVILNIFLWIITALLKLESWCFTYCWISPFLQYFHCFRFIHALLEEFKTNGYKSDVLTIVKSVEDTISKKLQPWRGEENKEELRIIDELTRALYLNGMETTTETVDNNAGASWMHKSQTCFLIEVSFSSWILDITCSFRLMSCTPYQNNAIFSVCRLLEKYAIFLSLRQVNHSTFGSRTTYQ